MAYPLDPLAAALLGRSHSVTARLLGSVNGSQFVIPLQLLPGGTVKVDGGSLVRRTLSCEVAGSLDSPTLDPLAAEVQAQYGLIDASGHTYWTPVGTFVLTDAKESRPGVVLLTGSDRWQRVNDARLETPVTTSGDTVAAITSLLQGADSRITVDSSAAPSGTHTSSLWDRERSDAIKALGASIGADVFFDATGKAVIRKAASLGDTSVWQVGRGLGGAKVRARRGMSRAITYNAVVVKGEPQGAAPVYAVARLTTGRLRWGGPYGKRPRFYSSSLVSTTAQAQAMADAQLAKVQGVAATLELESLPHPGLDAGDVLTVELDPGVWQRHLTQTFTLPLGLGTMPIGTRSDDLAGDSGQ